MSELDAIKARRAAAGIYVEGLTLTTFARGSLPEVDTSWGLRVGGAWPEGGMTIGEFAFPETATFFQHAASDIDTLLAALEAQRAAEARVIAADIGATCLYLCQTGNVAERSHRHGDWFHVVDTNYGLQPSRDTRYCLANFIWQRLDHEEHDELRAAVAAALKGDR